MYIDSLNCEVTIHSTISAKYHPDLYLHRQPSRTHQIVMGLTVTGQSTQPANMNGCNDLEQLTEQFRTICDRVLFALKNNSQDQRSLEKHRLAAIQAAQDALKLLQTQDELATQQTWMVSHMSFSTSIQYFYQHCMG